MVSLLDYPALLYRLLFVARKEKQFNFSEIGLALTVPKLFEIMNDKQIAKMLNRSMAETERVLGKTLNFPQRKLLFMARHELHNRMILTCTNLDELSENDWKRQNDEIYNSLLKLFYARYSIYKHVVIDTENGARQKENIIFNTLDIVASTPAREVFRTRLYSTVHKNYGIHITMSFEEAAIGEEMLQILRKATFS